MTIISKDDKSIKYKLNNTIKINDDRTFVVDLPKISCTKMEDALFLQQKINTYISDLTKELIKT